MGNNSIQKKASRVKCMPDFIVKLRAKAIFQKCYAYPNGDNNSNYYYYDDDSVFIGQLQEGRRSGQGQQFWFDEQHYHGEYHNDQFEGKGRLYMKDGSLYDGEWKQSKFHGQGLLIQTNGGKMQGQWKMGQLNDEKGEYRWLDGWVYQGRFIDGKRVGKGILSRGNVSYEVDDIELGSDKLDRDYLEYIQRKNRLNLSGSDSSLKFEQSQPNWSGTFHQPVKI